MDSPQGRERPLRPIQDAGQESGDR